MNNSPQTEKELSDPKTIDFIRKHQLPGTDVRKLALQSDRYPGVNLKVALEQISGWQTALHKLPAWAKTKELLYPPLLSMEQCSSEHTARYKATVLQSFHPTEKPYSLVDLTGGFGVDFSFLAPVFTKAVYVERQPILCQRARHNFPLLGLKNVEIQEADALDYLDTIKPVSWIYMDPARRDENGRKTVRISDCTPDIGAIQDLLKTKAGRILVKFSPMLDLVQVLRELPGIVEQIHVVAVSGECKELLWVLNGNLVPEFRSKIHAVDLLSDGTVRKFTFFKAHEEQAVCEYAIQPLSYLYEPHAALLKAGAYRLIAQTYGLKKMHPDAHLYTSDQLHAEFPGRCFCVQQFAGFNKKEIKSIVGDLKQAHVTIRGFPASVSELRKRLSLKEGGEDYFFATTTSEGKKILIRCVKPLPSSVRETNKTAPC